MGESICKSCIWLRFTIQNIERCHTTQHNNYNKNNVTITNHKKSYSKEWENISIDNCPKINKINKKIRKTDQSENQKLSRSIIFKEIQIKTTNICHLHPLEWSP